MQSDTPNWIGTAVATLTGPYIVNAVTNWELKFAIQPDNSVIGTATGQGAIGIVDAQANASAAPTTNMDVSGPYDPGSNNITLVLGLSA